MKLASMLPTSNRSVVPPSTQGSVAETPAIRPEEPPRASIVGFG